MEQQKQTLPSNIDNVILKLTKDLASIAEAYAILAAELVNKDKQIAELTPEVEGEADEQKIS